MLLALLLGMAAANSSLADSYVFLHHYPLRVGIQPLQLEAPLIDWINQGLLTVFFFQIGLHTKHEMTSGTLAERGTAAVPATAALGGMILPAAIYTGFNLSNPAALGGWAIPIATDIVLALGILSLFGNRLPKGVVAFVTAAAIFDDLGAVVVVAIFYGNVEAIWPLGFIASGFLALLVLNRRQYAGLAAYLAAGAVIWLGLVATGLEGAVAGVVVGLSLPLTAFPPHTASRAERRLSPVAFFVVVPIFAFFNGGVQMNFSFSNLAAEPIALGIVIALMIGKPAGVLAGTLLALRLRFGSLPDGATLRDIAGASLLAGIGFTMSLFIVTVAFEQPIVAETAKLAVLAGSAMSAIFALFVLRAGSSQTG